MYINKEDVTKILSVMEKFPEAASFELLEEGQSGIGSITSLIVHTTFKEVDGQFKIEISGVENW